MTFNPSLANWVWNSQIRSSRKDQIWRRGREYANWGGGWFSCGPVTSSAKRPLVKDDGDPAIPTAARQVCAKTQAAVNYMAPRLVAIICMSWLQSPKPCFANLLCCRERFCIVIFFDGVLVGPGVLWGMFVSWVWALAHKGHFFCGDILYEYAFLV